MSNRHLWVTSLSSLVCLLLRSPLWVALKGNEEENHFGRSLEPQEDRHFCCWLDLRSASLWCYNLFGAYTGIILSCFMLWSCVHFAVLPVQTDFLKNDEFRSAKLNGGSVPVAHYWDEFSCGGEVEGCLHPAQRIQQGISLCLSRQRNGPPAWENQVLQRCRL